MSVFIFFSFLFVTLSARCWYSILFRSFGHFSSLVHVHIIDGLFLLLSGFILGHFTGFLFEHLFDLDDKHFSHCLFLTLLVVKNVHDDFVNLLKDSVFVLVGINLLQKIVLTIFNAESSQPLAQRSLLNVKANYAINKGTIVVSILINSFKTFTQGCQIRGWLHIIDVVESLD